MLVKLYKLIRKKITKPVVQLSYVQIIKNYILRIPAIKKNCERFSCLRKFILLKTEFITVKIKIVFKFIKKITKPFITGWYIPDLKKDNIDYVIIDWEGGYLADVFWDEC
jgi:hypothetical protein